MLLSAEVETTKGNQPMHVIQFLVAYFEQIDADVHVHDCLIFLIEWNEFYLHANVSQKKNYN